MDFSKIGVEDIGQKMANELNKTLRKNFIEDLT